MARPQSKGLKYINLDVSFLQDRKIRRLIRRNGENAPLVYIALLCYIYTEGYYIKWDDDIILDLADAIRMDEKYIQDVIAGCLDVELLSRKMFDEHRILTSYGIQKQYQTICEQCKRKTTVEEYSLLVSSEGTFENNSTHDISSEETSGNNRMRDVSSEETLENSQMRDISSEDCKERKEAKERNIKQSKEKKSKENYYSSCCSSLPSEQAEEEEQQQDFFEIFFFKNFSEPSVEFRDKFLPWNNTGDRHWDQWDYTTRLAAVKQWEQRPARPRFRQSYFLEMWRKVVDRMHEIGSPPEIIRDALADELRWQEDLDGIRVTGYRLFCTKRLYDYIEKQHLPDFKPILWKYLSKNNRVNMNYTAYDEYNE